MGRAKQDNRRTAKRVTRGTILPGQLRLILAVTAVHLLSWLAYYGQLPLGQFPTGEENALLDQAEALAGRGESLEGPVSLYAAVLSVCARFASDRDGLVAAARFLNCLAVVFATGFTAAAAGRLWLRNRAVWIAGLLVGLNPVLAFWTGHIGPGPAATVCLAFAAWRLIRHIHHRRPLDSLWIGLALALGTGFEPALLPLALAWPLYQLLAGASVRPLQTVLAAAPTAALFGLAPLLGLRVLLPELAPAADWPANLYGFFNSHEYDPGKSYALHRASEYFLLLNPIHWGLILLLAVGGAYARHKNGHAGRSTRLSASALVLFALAYSAFGAGSPSRIAIIPLLAVSAGGAGYLPQIWRHGGLRTRRTLALGAVALAALSYSNLFSLRARELLEDDYIHLAEANLALGHSRSANRWALLALELDPTLDSMQYVLVRSRFDDWALAGDPKSLPTETVKARLQHLLSFRSDRPEMKTLEAIYRWKLRETEAAAELWEQHAGVEPLARLCLFWTGRAETPSPEELAAYAGHRDRPLLEAAAGTDRSSLGYGPTERIVDNLLAYAY